MFTLHSRLPIQLGTLLLPFVGYAAASTPTYQQGEYVPSGALPAGYTAPGRVDPEGFWDVTVEASFLYWQAKEKGLDFGYVVPTSPTSQSGTRLNKHFNYHPGFQLALSTDLHHDGWEVGAQYTYLHTREVLSSAIPNWANGIEATWYEDANDGGPAISSIVGASAQWKFNYDMVDIWMNRSSYIGRSLILTPEFGFRGGWIRQHFRPEYSRYASGSLFVRAVQRAALIGPRCGVKGRMLMGKGFYFDGGSYLALLYEDLHIGLKRQSLSISTALSTNVKNKERLFVPNVDLFLGLGWGSYFHQQKWYFDFNVNFDIQYYWEQNWMRHLKDASDERTDSDAGDLRLQGLTASTGFYF